MGLIKYLTKIKKSDKEAKLLVQGLDGAGKTTILKSISEENISTITPTKGFNIKNMSQDGVKLSVWDVGGHETLRDFWSNYYENANSLIYVIDAADEKRMAESGQVQMKLLAEDDLIGIPLLVFANKTDLTHALDPDEISELLELAEIKDRQWTIMRCSAYTKEGLKDGIEWVVEQIAANQKKQEKIRKNKWIVNN